MLGKVYFSIFLLIICFTGVFAQKAAAQQWEYLVVSGTEEFDELGKKGWELVGVSSEVINQGNQTFIKYIFKRPFDEERTKREAELKRQNYEKAKLEKEQETKFIDLDTASYLGEKETQENAAKEKLKQILSKLSGFLVINSDVEASFYPKQNRRFLKADLVIDASNDLLTDGNKYRSSEVDKYFQNAAQKIYKLFDLKPEFFDKTPKTYRNSNAYSGNHVTINISVVVKYKDATAELAKGYLEIDWNQLENF